ncbi:hypothetical protein CLV24_11361 [Pontibacter ummariensis]|uniref:Outer membrane protein beta-barrel domain-containing protein n=2 Tax=Pontibacter ummariensis TaxID=1610492 RepID=A0A239HCZ2_9BACT|nr:hypothetical protein CLV24_11361 [Pontibacter ummariensis]SNS79257.1 hypothetical protein SAMN06296052_11394 [Pontibacter ummariensis]
MLAFLLSLAASAQENTYGLTGRFGVFETLVNSNKEVLQDIDYAPGLQLELGMWMHKPLTEKGFLQLTYLISLERQSGGTMQTWDVNENPWADVRTRYGNFTVGLAAQYLHQVSERFAIGAGAGAKYKLAAIMATQFPGTHGGSTTELDEFYENHYHRKLRLYLPLGAQLTLGPQVHLLGQLQLSVMSRLAAKESAFRERDFGLVLGVNYHIW